MKLCVISVVLFLLAMGAAAQDKSPNDIQKRLPMKETPDSLTPGARHFIGWNFSRFFSTMWAFSFEYTTDRCNSLNLELAYKPALDNIHMSSRYSFFPRNVSRSASEIWSGKLSFRQYTRAGQNSFIYFGPYFRFDYLKANNAIIKDINGSDTYDLTRSTRLFKAGFSLGSRNIFDGFSFFWGVSVGAGIYDDDVTIIQLHPIDDEEHTIDYPYDQSYPVPDFTIDMGFAFGCRKPAMFGK